MSNLKKSAPVLSKDIQAHLDTLPTKSAKIRYLADQGYSKGDISRALGLLFQHVRNVLANPPKKQG